VGVNARIFFPFAYFKDFSNVKVEKKSGRQMGYDIVDVSYHGEVLPNFLMLTRFYSP